MRKTAGFDILCNFRSKCDRLCRNFYPLTKLMSDFPTFKVYVGCTGEKYPVLRDLGEDRDPYGRRP